MLSASFAVRRIIAPTCFANCVLALSLPLHAGTNSAPRDERPTPIVPSRLISSTSRDTLPPLVEPLVPREVPAPWRSAVQACALVDRSPLEVTWHLSVLNRQRRRENTLPASITPGWHDESFASAQWLFRLETSKAIDSATFGAADAWPIVGDFNGDGRSDLGLFRDGEWFIDLNGNHRWDEHDMWLQLGAAGDQPVTGDWNGDGTTDIGVFGNTWLGDDRALDHEHGLRDADNPAKSSAAQSTDAHRSLSWRTVRCTADAPTQCDPVDHVLHFGARGDIAVVGDFNGDGVDTIGIYRRGRWVLDVNGDGRFDEVDRNLELGTADDLPLVADIDGDGSDEIGLFRAGRWQFDLDHDGRFGDRDLVFEMGQAGDLPLIGKFTDSGKSRFAVYRTRQSR